MRFGKTLLFSLVFSFISVQLWSQGENTIVMDELEIVGDLNSTAHWPIGSSQRQTDVIHVQLDLNFDLERAAVNGKAQLYCTPYFSDLDTVILNAQAFELHKVAVWSDAEWKELKYQYDGHELKIALDQTRSRKDTFKLGIDYTANPDSIKAEGGLAITSAKGLYFINGKNEEGGFMPQFWTQGEPESNSAWFPVVDKPNEKITHEISMTVDTSWMTLSNGKIEFTTDNGDGTRTDYWAMRQPHAPYLVMMAAGAFSTTDTLWNGIPVKYIVEPEWEDHSKRIFGNTPELLSFYSDLLGVSYPWNKYDQIVVREYVSGAMENTTAVVFGDFMYTDAKAFNDETHEDVVAHEMFHHWFGDYVTCESWGQLPLNESFATYGEYLWIEHKYGKEEADWHLYKDLQNYMTEFNFGHRPNMIRYDEENPLEMFDHHSYAKGGRILHMLRNYLGDEAFFLGLQHYLKSNAYGTAEIHDLRKSFEHISGQDLNWFFNQWFLDNGHPVLEVSYAYDKETYTQHVTVKQVQDIVEYPLFIIPLNISVHTKKGSKTYKVVLNKQEQTFSFKTDAIQPSWVSFDSDKMLLCEKDDQLSDAYLLSQLAQSKLMLDRREAVIGLAKTKNSNLRSTIAGIAMKDPSPYVRIEGLNMLSGLNEAGLNKVSKDVKRLAEDDENNRVRAAAISALSEVYDKNEKKIYEKGWEANSYIVNAAALEAIAKHNSKKGLETARQTLRSHPRSEMYIPCWRVLSQYGEAGDLELLYNSVMSTRANWQKQGLIYMGNYAKYHSGNEEQKAIDLLFSIAQENPELKNNCLRNLDSIIRFWQSQLEQEESKSAQKELSQKIEDLEARVNQVY
ncbi:MAG: M1 family metallopeptidase [Schleiferiaceae bacterium]|nr:M1 family metallopeptidase [Schleiferiaceae bacterium]